MLLNYPELCYSTNPSNINPNSLTYIYGEYNYIYCFKDNLVDDERILRGLYGNNIAKIFYDKKEDYLSFINSCTNKGENKADLVIVSDNFWIDMKIGEEMIEIENETSFIGNLNYSAKLILDNPVNRSKFDKFKKMVVENKDNIDVGTFSLSRLWDNAVA